MCAAALWAGRPWPSSGVACGQRGWCALVRSLSSCLSLLQAGCEWPRKRGRASERLAALAYTARVRAFRVGSHQLGPSPPAASEPTEPAAEPAAAPAVAAAAEPADAKPEMTFYEGSGAPAELVISLLLGATVLYLPLTLASIGRRLWIRYKFTNKRLIITTNSPVFKREVQVGGATRTCRPPSCWLLLQAPAQVAEGPAIAVCTSRQSAWVQQAVRLD